MNSATVTARRLWTLFEPLHAVTYLAPPAHAVAEAAGYGGFWMGYFAQRSAPLGAASAALVTAAFYGFHPSRVHACVPDCWNTAGPHEALQIRLRGVSAAYAEAWGPQLMESPSVAEAAELLWTAAQYADSPGRPLGAANQALPKPDEPHLALWQATTTLRELRGDGHIAALVAHDISALDSLILKVAEGESAEPRLRRGKAWPVEQWDAAVEQLRDRGLLDRSCQLTADGIELRHEVERCTDQAAASPWRLVGSAQTARAAALLQPLAARIRSARWWPPYSPIGLPPT